MARSENIGLVAVLWMMLFVGYCRADNDGEQYRLKIVAPQLSSNRVQLRQCVNGFFTIIDSAYTTARGKAELMYAPLEKGIYTIRIGRYEYDFLMGDEQGDLTFRIDTFKRHAFVKCKAPHETERFNRYKQFLYDCKNKRQTADKEGLKQLDEQVENYSRRLVEENRGNYLADFVQMTSLFSRETPEKVWEKLSLENRFLWNNTYLPYKIRGCLQQAAMDGYASFCDKQEKLLDKVGKDTVVYEYLLAQIFSVAAADPYVEGENIRAFLTERYLLPNENRLLPERNSFLAEYEATRYCKLGQTAPDLVLRNRGTDELVELRSLASPLVLLCFYDTDCEHCMQAMPEYLDLYRKYREQGLEIVAVYIGFEEDEWKGFIDRMQCDDWMNVFALRDNPLFWQYYDVTHTPAIYLLNKQREIIAKRCDLRSLEQVIKQYISIDH